MKIPHQDDKTAQISASNGKPMVGQGELDLIMEMPETVGSFDFTIHISDFRERHWFRAGIVPERTKEGLIIFTNDLEIWSIVI